MPQPSCIQLSPNEQTLFDSIPFDRHLFSEPPRGAQEAGRVAAELFRLLQSRNAIPQVRLRWFCDPELNVGTNKSRLEVFESNGTLGEDIFHHPHFQPYLKYIICGPDLPPQVINEFSTFVTELPFVSGGDMERIEEIVRTAVRRQRLDPRKVADEFWKLALECGVSDIYARAIRDNVRRMKA